jgi:hypothetical protein
MQRKRVFIGVAALVACVAIGSATVAVARLHKVGVKTTITLSETPAVPGPGATFSGQVSAKGPSGCLAGRTVTVSRIGPVQTQPDGSYSIAYPYQPEPGTYTANVTHKVIKDRKKNKRFVCNKAVSAPIVVP